MKGAGGACGFPHNHKVPAFRQASDERLIRPNWSHPNGVDKALGLAYTEDDTRASRGLVGVSNFGRLHCIPCLFGDEEGEVSMNRVWMAAIILAGTFAMTGCVSDRKYQEALAETESANIHDRGRSQAFLDDLVLP